jgi:hypothetical protein
MDQNLEDIDSLSVNYFAMGGPVGQMPAAQPIAFDGPLNMADGGLVDINSLSVAAFAEGGEVKEEAAYTEQEIDRMRAAMAQSQADKEPRSPTQQAVKRITPRATAQGPQQKSSLARQQLYALPPYPLDMTGKLGQAGPIKRAEGSPEYGEIAEQMTVGTPLPTDQGPSLASQGLNLLKQAGQTVYGNLREAVTDPVAFNKRALGNVAQQLQSDPQEFIMNWTGGGLGGIIRPKGGGNLLAGDVEKAIKPLRITAQYQGDKYASDYLNELKKQYGTLPEAETGYAKTLVQEAALDDWIKNKFGNYVKKQMGTEDDPVRKLADEMSAKVQTDYQAGLKRIAKMKDDIAKAKAKGKGTEASEVALADEIEKVDEAFQSTSMLPSQLGPYTHVNASIGRAREKAGMSPFETAKSNLGKSYEELADAPFAPTTKKEIDARIKAEQDWSTVWSPEGAKFTDNPWLAKLGEEDLVYRIRPLEINEKEIFTHTIDELRNALNPNSGLPPNLLLKPEDMQGLGIEKAFRHVNNINDWRAQQRVAANLADAQRSATTIKEYPDTPKKLKWQQLKPAEYTELPPGYSVTSSYEGPALFGPDGKKLTTFSAESKIPVQQQALNFIAKNDLEKALQYEGSTMRHCVGGYCDSVWSGETNIFSLRDKKGEPHVTIETAGHTTSEFLNERPGIARRLGLDTFDLEAFENWNYSRERYNSELEQGFENLTKQILKMPEFMEWAKLRPAEILQIKGKGNAKPKEEYIPFIQDFIKSQQWSRIGDLNYTDLVALKPRFLKNAQDRGIAVDVVTEQSGKPYITKTEFNRLADLFGGMTKYPD